MAAPKKQVSVKAVKYRKIGLKELQFDKGDNVSYLQSFPAYLAAFSCAVLRERAVWRCEASEMEQPDGSSEVLHHGRSKRRL